MRIGVILPCRDEASVIERKLRNLAAAHWPEGDGAHRLLIVDDGSTDGTGARARELLPRLFDATGVRAECVPNEVRPGKNGALCTGLELLEREVDLIVITDADVSIDEWALHNLARAFENDARLGMACGAQRFVPELRDDGRIAGIDGGSPGTASTVFDRLSALGRILESKIGRLFSVHGQLLAWRAELGLRPTEGVAADDIDLRLELRARDPVACIERLPNVLFYEEKTPPGERADAQALRRARAYLQIFRARQLPAGADLVDRLQWRAYRALPTLFPWLLPWLLIVVFCATVALGLQAPIDVRLTTWLLIGVIPDLLITFLGARDWRRISLILARAQREEGRAALSERWEMRRS